MGLVVLLGHGRAASWPKDVRRLTIGTLVCLSIGLIASRAPAGSLTVPLAGDTFINSAHPDNNNGLSPSLFTGTDGQNGFMRGLLQFTMPGGLQGRVTISSVQLGLTTQLFPNGNNGTAAIASLHAITEGWSEGNGVGNTQNTYVVGQLCGGGIFGASWNRPDCTGGTFWTAGGAVSASVSGSASVPASGGSSVVWPSQPGMVGDVQSWIDTPSSNHGWLISTSTEGFGFAGQAQRFVSKEGGAGAPSLAITYACKPGFLDTGNSCTACTPAATAACVTSQGNVCNDTGPPSTTYTCSCLNAAYVGSGTPSCVDRNECLPNNCSASGDSGAVCTDHVAPATGYDCTCSSGYSFSGGTCVDANACVSNPCGAGGDTGAFCTDQPAPSTGYDCKCSSGYSFNGSTCLDTNACTVNHCRDNGDSAAACIDQPAPSSGYDCKCSDGFSFNGVSCIGPPPAPVPVSGSALLAVLLGALSLGIAWARTASESRRGR